MPRRARRPPDSTPRPDARGFPLPVAARLLRARLHVRGRTIARREPVPHRAVPLARDQRGRRARRREQRHSGRGRSRVRGRRAGRHGVRGRGLRSARVLRPRARRLAAPPESPWRDARRHRHRQLRARGSRAVRRITNAHAALGSACRIPRTLPRPERDAGAVRDRRAAHHLRGRHRVDRHDARPDRPTAWRRTRGGDLRAVRRQPHPAAFGQPAARDRRALWRAQPQADPGDRHDAAAHGKPARLRRTRAGDIGHAASARTAVQRDAERHADALLPEPAPRSCARVAAADRHEYHVGVRRVRLRIAVAFLAHVPLAFRREPAQRPPRDALNGAAFAYNPARYCARRLRLPPFAEQCRRMIDGPKQASKIICNVAENVL
ncbi:hypothetical protein EMIT0158MI4_20215 [Burkholderia ambifaria]